jgi:ribosome-binding protein aMBF1 (putative translation factor)
MARNKDFAQVIRKKLDLYPGLAEIVEDNRFSMKVSRAVYAARMQAGLTQGQLAARAGTHQSVIARLEDADYDGHSMTMLKRIGDALDKDLCVEFRDRRTAQWSVVASNAIGLANLPWEQVLDWTPTIHMDQAGAETLETSNLPALIA